MQVEVSDAVGRTIDEFVASGSYGSATEIVEAAMALLQREADYRADLAAKVEAGLRDLDEGRSILASQASADARVRLAARGRG